LNSNASDSAVLACDLIAAVAESGDLLEIAMAWLRSQNIDPDLFARHCLETKSLHEFELVWREQLPKISAKPAAHLVYEIILSFINRSSIHQSVLGIIDGGRAPAAQRDDEAINVLLGFASMLNASGAYTILLDTPHASSPDWIESAATRLAEIANSSPALPVALAASLIEAEAFLRKAPQSRLATLLREGRVDLESSITAAAPMDTDRFTITVPSETATALERIGASSKLRELLREAVARLAESVDRTGEDRARSAAERFLFEVLESWSATAGKFKLNQPLEFVHGSSAALGDLVAPVPRLAIELDGGYHHLRDFDAYRRDRRKDYGYQRHGYLVLRFLSEDVVTRLDEILRTIVEALDHQARSADGSR
jgi:very-short-patch-repair endonuclease